MESNEGTRPAQMPQQPMKSSGFNARAMMEYDSKKRNVVLAYVLLIVVGWLGVHRLYVERKSGWIMLGLFVAGLLSAVVFWETPFLTKFPSLRSLGVVFWGTPFGTVLFIWMLIDSFLLYGYVENYNSKLIDKINH